MRLYLALPCLMVGLQTWVVQGASAPDEPGRAVEEIAAEPWADPGLKVKQGLMLWLDAGRLNAARKAHAEAEIVGNARVGTWYDASGHGRHLTQSVEAAQPQYLEGAVRFDGEASYLERAGLDLHIKDFTLFLVAAPLTNGGGFRAFAALRQDGQLDYSSGVTVDMGPGISGRFETLNVEGKGFNGAENLLTAATSFGIVRRMTVTSSVSPGGIKLFMDGQAAGARDRAVSIFDTNRILVGARFYGSPGAIRGFLEGDVLQVLLYDRVLNDQERAEVEAYLATRLGGPDPVTRPGRTTVGKPLVAVPNPPPVQMLVPGYAAREIPVELANVNNVRYRHDGKLVALRYDGNIELLSDRDGDGLEETVERFWENTGSLVAPIGMALTPPNDPRGEGVFVASKGKVSLIIDPDRDGKADEEIVIAKGWKELPHGVDALGVAVDDHGAVYFGLGTTDFTNAYVLNDKGEPGYRLEDEHGTIQKIAADFSGREIIATGIRFPVGLAFNRNHDLFATDQEGATWLPNGNPFDELLYIRPKRHYGFPPRHPTHLPSVIDEPSVFDYAPQHQSTCGLFFNEAVNGGPVFGPAHWAGDALVTGYSRGKLYRTKLAKTDAGYIAQNQMFAVLDMLPADACVSPRGDLVVAAHSGQPDWGSGPKGIGKLFQIRRNQPETAQPVLVYAAGPQEVRVVFDRPLDPAQLRDLVKRTSIEYGRAVSPADRFESLRPGYEVVGRQLATPRFELPILSAQISTDSRSLLLATAPHPEAVSYALTLPAPMQPAGQPPAMLPQVAEIDLGYDLSGVDVQWKPELGQGGWSGWLPHPNLAVSREFTAGSADHDRLWKSISTPGRITLRSRLNLWQLLRPAVQPGSTPGYQLPEEDVTLTVTASGPLSVSSTAECTNLGADRDGKYRTKLRVKPREREWLPLEISMPTGAAPFLDVTWETAEDDRPRALPLRRVLLPWATVDQTTELAQREIPELKGGDWGRGRDLFYGAEAKCATCHKVGGRGGEIGPDLSNLIHRDYASVYRDIHTPSVAINPDYIAHSVALKDGRVLQGTLRTEGERLIVGDTEGKQVAVARADVEAMSASSVSIMPEGLDVSIGPEKLRDLLTFLLTDPLGAAKLEIEGAPTPCRRSELNAALAGSTPIENPRELRVLLAAGPKDHGPGEHDYPLWLKRWSVLLGTDKSLVVETAEGWPSVKQLDAADLIVFYSNNPGWDLAKAEALDRFLARGGGVVLIHYAVDGHEAVDALAERIGLAWQGGKSAFRHGALDVDFSGSTHPITRGLTRLKLEDESYWNLVGDSGSIQVLGTGVEDGEPRPLFWTREHGKGRVFVSIPGHYTWSFDDPLFRLLILRGMAWSASEPIDRFNHLTTLGARITE